MTFPFFRPKDSFITCRDRNDGGGAQIAVHLRRGGVFATFHHFVRSDILFVAKSTFSYLGGVIGGNVCISEPFWHPSLPGWIRPEELDQPGLANLLKDRARSRLLTA